MLKTIEQKHILNNETTEAKRPNYTMRRLLAAGSIALASLGVWKATELTTSAVDHVAHPLSISSVEHTFTAQAGEGLYDAADTVKGVDQVDTRDVITAIEAIPENKKPLADGLQVGETIEVPDSVTPH